MNTIINNLEAKYHINKSLFITNLFQITNDTDINICLNSIKKTYPDATHHCYAYIYENIERFSDDGEPSGTAGMPILNVLKKQELTNVLCVVTRYYGGVKLGTGGLVRAYSNSTSNTLKNNTETFIQYQQLTITFPYDCVTEVNYHLKDIKILDKSFTETISYKIEVPLTDIDVIKEKLKHFLI